MLLQGKFTPLNTCLQILPIFQGQATLLGSHFLSPASPWSRLSSVALVVHLRSLLASVAITYQTRIRFDGGRWEGLSKNSRGQIQTCGYLTWWQVVFLTNASLWQKEGWSGDMFLSIVQNQSKPLFWEYVLLVPTIMKQNLPSWSILAMPKVRGSIAHINAFSIFTSRLFDFRSDRNFDKHQHVHQRWSVFKINLCPRFCSIHVI